MVKNVSKLCTTQEIKSTGYYKIIFLISTSMRFAAVG